MTEHHEIIVDILGAVPDWCEGEIVRCRDCKYYMDYEHEYEPNLGYCGFHDMQEVRDSRFCAWGKRKESGDD